MSMVQRANCKLPVDNCILSVYSRHIAVNFRFNGGSEYVEHSGRRSDDLPSTYLDATGAIHRPDFFVGRHSTQSGGTIMSQAQTFAERLSALRAEQKMGVRELGRAVGLCFRGLCVGRSVSPISDTAVGRRTSAPRGIAGFAAPFSFRAAGLPAFQRNAGL